MIDTEEITDAQLQSTLLQPSYSFRGESLWPYSRAARHAVAMLYERGHDLFLFEWLALIWVLKKRGGKDATEDFRNYVLPMIDNQKSSIRTDIILWRNDLTSKDELEAERIGKDMYAQAAASDPIVPPEMGAKKKETAPPTSDTSATSSPSPTGGRRKKPSSTPAS